MHSYIYYDLNSSLITDETFDEWAQELVRLKNKHLEEFKASEYYKDFITFEGSTGMDLLYRVPWVEAVATNLIEMKRGVHYKNRTQTSPY